MAPVADSVNDIGDPSEPSYTAVAVCTGTDLDGNPVTLTDRLCMNREGVAIVIGEVNSVKQQLQKCETELESKTPDRALTKSQYCAYAVLGLIIIACVRWIGRIGSRG